MRKIFCDICGEETERDFVSDTLGGNTKEQGQSISLTISVSLSPSCTKGDVCFSCLHRIAKRIMDRTADNAKAKAKAKAEAIKAAERSSPDE